MGASQAGAPALWRGRARRWARPAEPVPREHPARPDAVGDRRGELRRGLLDARELEWTPGANPDLARTDPPALANVLGADPRNGDDRRTGLEREPADAALRL